jgi:hypothetical protein
MRRTTILFIALAATTAIIGTPAAPATAGDDHRDHGDASEPVLELQATLSADFLAPGPPSGAASTPANGRTPPYAGQVIPGFSGMIDNGDGTFWAMPDNGFGAKGNSADFLLRLYRITLRWKGGRGDADGSAWPVHLEPGVRGDGGIPPTSDSSIRSSRARSPTTPSCVGASSTSSTFDASATPAGGGSTRPTSPPT